ncbi:GNAT family N-acetyltransferase [Nonomuraea sp. NPDC003707]
MADNAQGELRLQQLTEGDHASLAKWSFAPTGAYSQGMVYTQGVGITAFTSLRETRESLARPGVSCLMVQAGDGSAIGAFTWHTIEHAKNHLIDMCIGGPELWRDNNVVQAVLLLLDYLFHAKNAHRVQMTIGLHNKHLMELVTEGHLTPEALLRDYLFVDGEYHDAVLCSVLREEYYARQSGRDLVPAVEKDEARSSLLAYLREQPANYLASILDR